MLLGRTAQTNPFFTMSKEQSQTLFQRWKLDISLRVMYRTGAAACSREMVEADGIEPTT
jgi:hypothetical protein